MTTKAKTSGAVSGETLVVVEGGAAEASSYDDYPPRAAQLGDLVEYFWEDDDGTLHEQLAQVWEIYDRHILGLPVSNAHQKAERVEYSSRPRPNTWRFR